MLVDAVSTRCYDQCMVHMHGAWRQARFRPRTRRRSPTASGRTSVRSERRAAGHHRSGSLDSFPPPFLTHFSALSSAIPPHTHHAGRVTHHAGRVIPGESSRRVAEKLYFLGSALLLAHASGMLIGACNPMSCPCTSGGGPAAQRPATRCGDRPYHAGRGGAGQPDGVRSQLRDDSTMIWDHCSSRFCQLCATPLTCAV